MPPISDKEKSVQIALGTWNTPDLIVIDLRKTNKNNNTHPDMKVDEAYLIYAEFEFKIGWIDSDTGLFCSGSYEQTIDECAAIWLIKGRK